MKAEGYCEQTCIPVDTTGLKVAIRVVPVAFGPKSDLGGCATKSLNRWAAALMEYDVTAVHIEGTENKVCEQICKQMVPEVATGPDLLHMHDSLLKPVQTGNKVSEDLAKNMFIKCVTSDECVTSDGSVTSDECVTSDEIDSATGIMDIAKCLSQPSDPKVEDITSEDLFDETLGKFKFKGELNKNYIDLNVSVCD